MAMTEHPHVDLTSGRAVVRGTRVPASRLWFWHTRGIKVETLVRRYPSLGWARVLDALSWCYDNTERAEQELAEQRELLGADKDMEQQKLPLRGDRG